MIIRSTQLNCELEKEKRKPKLSNLRESGDIEAKAHVVMFPYENPDDHTFEMIIAKHRNSPIGRHRPYIAKRSPNSRTMISNFIPPIAIQIVAHAINSHKPGLDAPAFFKILKNHLHDWNVIL